MAAMHALLLVTEHSAALTVVADQQRSPLVHKSTRACDRQLAVALHRDPCHHIEDSQVPPSALRIFCTPKFCEKQLSLIQNGYEITKK